MWSIFGVKLNYIVSLGEFCNNSTLFMELFMISGLLELTTLGSWVWNSTVELRLPHNLLEILTELLILINWTILTSILKY